MPRRDPLEPATRQASKPKKPVPFPFVLDELADLEPRLNPMFGCHAVYIGERIVFILRDKGPADADRGVWVVSEKNQVDAVRALFPNLRRIDALGDFIKNWQKLSANDPTFEEDVLAACALIARRDPRLGKLPEPKKPKAPKTSTEKAPKKVAKKVAKKVGTKVGTKASKPAPQQVAKTATKKAAKKVPAAR
jgi:hypothetical protein